MARPSIYKEEYCKLLIEHMSEGLSYETFAAKIGTCRQTLYEWEKVHPEFLDTKKRAQEISQLWWEMAGVNGLYTIVEHGEGGEKTIIEKKINSAMWIFNMKARFRWQDTEPKEQQVIPERDVLTLDGKKSCFYRVKKNLGS